MRREASPAHPGLAQNGPGDNCVGQTVAMRPGTPHCSGAVRLQDAAGRASGPYLHPIDVLPVLPAPGV
jgi:hypothetical protein